MHKKVINAIFIDMKTNNSNRRNMTEVNNNNTLEKNKGAKSGLNEEIQNERWMDIETARQRLYSFVDKLENTYGNANSN